MEIAWIKNKYVHVYLSKGNKNSCNKHKEVINSQPDEERHDDVCPTYILLNICEIYPRIKEIIIIIICIPIIVHVHVSTKLVLKVPLLPLFIRVINHSLIHLSSSEIQLSHTLSEPLRTTAKRYWKMPSAITQSLFRSPSQLIVLAAKIFGELQTASLIEISLLFQLFSMVLKYSHLLLTK